LSIATEICLTQAQGACIKPVVGPGRVDLGILMPKILPIRLDRLNKVCNKFAHRKDKEFTDVYHALSREAI
jgi:hypothetical protein